MFHQKTAWDVIHEQAYCHDEAANHQLLIVAVFWIIRIVSMEECSNLTQNLIQICCFTCSFILNEMATQYTYSLNSIYRPHWLVQWSRHCLHMHIPVHSPHLPGYIYITKTILVILIMAGLLSRQTYYTMENIQESATSSWRKWYLGKDLEEVKGGSHS